MTQEKKENKSILDNIRMVKGYDPVLHIAICALAMFGILMIGSAAMGDAVGDYKVLLLAIAKQVIFVSAGYFFMTYASRHFKLSSLHGNMFSILSGMMIIFLLICLAFPEMNNARAWIRIPLGITDITIQPSEFAKIVTYLIVAAHLCDRHNFKGTAWQLIQRPALIVLSYFVIIAGPQGDFGSAVVLALVFFASYLIPTSKKLKPTQVALRVLFYFAVVVVLLTLFSPYGESIIESLPLKQYQKNRILTAIDPFADEYGNGYQLIQSLIAMSGGGWLGTGYGRSVRKYMNFPEATTDYILGVTVEELGFLGFLGLLAIYCVIIYRMFWYASKIKSEPAKVILVGSSLYFIFHVFFNVGGVSGLIPLTGIPLPLMSAGGSSAVSFMLSIGLSQAVIASYKRGEIK